MGHRITAEKEGETCREICSGQRLRPAFSAKINGQRPFDTEEAVRLCEVLGISDNQKKCDIFLTRVPQ